MAAKSATLFPFYLIRQKNIFLCFLALFLRSKSQCGYKSNINVNVVALAQVPLPDALTFSIFGEYRSSL